MAKIVYKNRAAFGGAPMLVSHDFGCPKCRVYFEGMSYFSEALGKVMPLVHEPCGTRCERVVKPGTRMAIRGGESNSIGKEMRSEWQRYWDLTDDQMKHVTRDSINREMKNRGLHWEDASFDENANGARRAAGQAYEVPPDTDDPNAVRDYKAKRYGREFVVEEEQQIRTMYNEALRNESSGVSYDPLPKAATTDVHSTPHKIDLEKTKSDLAAAPVVPSDRRQEIQGRLITGK